MNRQVNHKSIIRKTSYGIITTTLCGRNNSRSNNDGFLNVNEDVTCKFCLKAMQTTWGKKLIEASLK